MAVILPALPRNAEYVIRQVSFDRDLTPPFGGDESRIGRLGTRHEIDVGIPAISAVACGPALVADIAVGRHEGVVMAIPEPKLPILDYGAPVVNGGAQTGSTLTIDGLTPGVTVPKGKWLSVSVNGRRYAYFTTAAVVANGGGQAALPIFPMLRRSPADNAVVELAAPKIEGLIRTAPEWSPRKIGSIGISFTVRERG